MEDSDNFEYYSDEEFYEGDDSEDDVFGMDPLDLIYDTPSPSDKMSCPNYKHNFYPLSKSQKLLETEMSTSMKRNGIISMKSAGSGKSCGAMNVATNFAAEGWKVIFVTRKTLKDIPTHTMFHEICPQKVRDVVHSGEPLVNSAGQPILVGGMPIISPEDKIAFIRTPRGALVLGNQYYNLKVQKQRVISYNEFIQMLTGKTVLGKQLRKKQLADSPNNDVLYKTLLIVDEAHNLLTKTLPFDERRHLGTSGYKTIWEALHKSYNISDQDRCRVLLLTATPMNEDFTHMMKLMNLILDVNEQLSVDQYDYIDKDTNINQKAIKAFADKCNEIVSYLNISNNPEQFPLKIMDEIVTVDLNPIHSKHIKKVIGKLNSSVDIGKLSQKFYSSELAFKTVGNVYSKKVLERYENSNDSDYLIENLKKIYRDKSKRVKKIYPTIGRKRKSTSKTPLKSFSSIKRSVQTQSSNYEEISRAYNDYRHSVYTWFQLSTKEKPPPIPSILKGAINEYGELRTYEEFVKCSGLKCIRPTNDQVLYSLFITRDSQTGEIRLKSEDEFVVSQMNSGMIKHTSILPDKEDGPNISFLMWHRKYNAEEIRRVAHIYVPKIHKLIKMVLHNHKTHIKKFGVPTKHFVFTNSQDDGKLIASIFRAYEDDFKLCMEFTNKGLSINVPKDRLGVVLLSSGVISNINRIYKGWRGRNQIQFNTKTVSAITKAFNNSDSVQIMIADSRYQQGISLSNTGFYYSLDIPVTRTELEQSSSRVTRLCRSTKLPFANKTGAMVSMQFINTRTSEGETTYNMLLDAIPDKIKSNINMVQMFTTVVSENALDYEQNKKITEYKKRIKGVISNIHLDNSYPYVMKCELSVSDEVLPFYFTITDMDIVPENQINVGSKIMVIHHRELQGSKGVVHAINYPMCTVQVGDQRLDILLGYVRLYPGQTIYFDIPNGIDLATNLLNIGDIRKYGHNQINLPRYDRMPKVTNTQPKKRGSYVVSKVAKPVTLIRADRANMKYIEDAFNEVDTLEYMLAYASISKWLSQKKITPPSLYYQGAANAFTDIGIDVVPKGNGMSVNNGKFLRSFLRTKEQSSVATFMISQSPVTNHICVSLLVWNYKDGVLERLDVIKPLDEVTQKSVDRILKQAVKDVDVSNTYMSSGSVGYNLHYVIKRLEVILSDNKVYPYPNDFVKQIGAYDNNMMEKVDRIYQGLESEIRSMGLFDDHLSMKNNVLVYGNRKFGWKSFK